MNKDSQYRVYPYTNNRPWTQLTSTNTNTNKPITLPYHSNNHTNSNNLTNKY